MHNPSWIAITDTVLAISIALCSSLLTTFKINGLDFSLALAGCAAVFVIVTLATLAISLKAKSHCVMRSSLHATDPDNNNPAPADWWVRETRPRLGGGWGFGPSSKWIDWGGRCARRCLRLLCRGVRGRSAVRRGRRRRRRAIWILFIWIDVRMFFLILFSGSLYYNVLYMFFFDFRGYRCHTLFGTCRL